MSDIDQQFIEYVVKSLVGNPDAVQVDRRIDEKGVLLELTVDPEDLGRIIGKRGATAQSLRTLLRALGTKNDARYNLKIVDNGVGEYAHHDDSATPVATDDINDTSSISQAPAAEPDEEVVTDTATASDDATEPVDAPSDISDEPDDRESDRLRKTRAELADLDDLDV